jgi:hypothetical protein
MASSASDTSSSSETDEDDDPFAQEEEDSILVSRNIFILLVCTIVYSLVIYNVSFYVLASSYAMSPASGDIAYLYYLYVLLYIALSYAIYPLRACLSICNVPRCGGHCICAKSPDGGLSYRCFRNQIESIHYST